MRPLLRRLLDASLLAPLDAHFAETLARVGGGAPDEVALALAVTSRQTRLGHVCVRLDALAGSPFVDPEGTPLEGSFPTLERWQDELRSSPLVGSRGAFRPLILDGERLYLERYFDHETRLAELLRARLGSIERTLDRTLLRGGLVRLFPDEAADNAGSNLQRRAAQAALENRFCIISGGPGTGKTSTVVRLLALLFEQARARGGRPPRVLLMAPTGKAAARLAEAVRSQKRELATDPEIRDAIPDTASTIHRALGVLGGGTQRFRHDARHPLMIDAAVIDEASMVDIALMRRTVEAIPEAARLILLGDADQLVSVEAGAVLGDIVAAADQARTGPGTLVSSVVRLQRSYRFSAEGGIGALASAVRAGDEARVRAELDSGKNDEVSLVPGDARLGSELRNWVLEHYASYLREQSPADALSAFEKVRMLSAHRHGPFGAEALNPFIEAALTEAGLLEGKGEPGAMRYRSLYRGRPLLVTENDYTLGLYNGDIGIALPSSAEPRAALSVHFAGENGVRAVSAARLPGHETAFCMSIHKSQGSEFDEVAIVLPEATSPLLSRELLYTAVTRARRRVTIFAPLESVLACVRRPIRRASGLTEALRG